MRARVSLRWWIAPLLVLPCTVLPRPLPAGSGAASACVQVAPAVDRMPQTPAAGGLAGAKPRHEFSGCFWLVLGVGGSLLAWSAGMFAPVLALLLVRAALEICA